MCAAWRSAVTMVTVCIGIIAAARLATCDGSQAAPRRRQLLAAPAPDNLYVGGRISAAYADSSWCKKPRVSFATVTRNASGKRTRVISYTPKNGCGLQLFRQRFKYLPLGKYKSITLLLNGGSKGGQKLQLGIADSRGKRHVASLAPFLPKGKLEAGRWRRVTVPLTALDRLNEATASLHSVYLVPEWRGAATQPQLYVDAIQVLPKTVVKTPTPRRTPTPTPKPTGPTQRLHTTGNGIFTADGRRWRARGVNVMDPRSNSQCWPVGTDLADTAAEVTRRINAAVGWGANVIRLMLENHANANDGFAAGPSAYLDAIQEIARRVGDHPGVYLMVSFWQDPTLTDGKKPGTPAGGWPTQATNARWTRLVGYLAGMDHVMFGVVNEPENNFKGTFDAACWSALNSAVAAIRAAEADLGASQHVVVVQGTRDFSRYLGYYETHPISAGGGKNIAYETHVYNHAADFAALITQPAKKLPIIIGEFGPAMLDNNGDGVKEEVQSIAEAQQLMKLAESLQVPWIAWSFSEQSDPSMLLPAVRPAGDFEKGKGCHVRKAAIALQPNVWGKAVQQRLGLPYNA